MESVSVENVVKLIIRMKTDVMVFSGTRSKLTRNIIRRFRTRESG